MFEPRFISFVFTLLLLGVTPQQQPFAFLINASLQPQEERRGERLRPPGVLNCSRNDLTSFTGRVLSYTRGSTRLFLRLRTDEQTTESFTLHYGRQASPARWFLLRAEPFKAQDWKLIESRRGRLRAGMRATVWVCNDGSKPVIDWQPPER